MTPTAGMTAHGGRPAAGPSGGGRADGARDGGWRSPAGRRPRVRAAPARWRVRGRSVWLRPRVQQPRADADRQDALPALVRGPDARAGARARGGPRAGGRQPLRHAAGRRGHAPGRAARRASHPPEPAPAGRRPGLRDPAAGAAGQEGRPHPGLPRQRERAAALGRAGRRLPGGIQGHRQALLGPLPAAAVRPRRLRGHRHPGPGADHPLRDRRGRGDLSPCSETPGR